MKKNESLKTESAKIIIDREIKEVRSKITEIKKTCKMLNENFILSVEEAFCIHKPCCTR